MERRGGRAARGGGERERPPPPAGFGGAVPGDYAITRTLPGAYDRADRRPRGAWTFEIGSRFDLPEDHARAVEPAPGVSWRPGRSGRPASTPRPAAPGSCPASSPWPARRSSAAIPDLRPETVLGGDLGIEWQLAAGQPRRRPHPFLQPLRGPHRLRLRDLPPPQPLGGGGPGGRGASSWQPDGPAVAPRQRHLAGGGGPDRPRPGSATGRSGWAARAWSGRPAPDVDLQLDLQAVSRSFDEQIPVPDRDTVPGRELAGARRAPGRWPESWRLRGRIDNLTDEALRELIGFPGAGRSFRLGLR